MRTSIAVWAVAALMLAVAPATNAAVTGIAGQGLPHANMQPFLALNYLVNIDGYGGDLGDVGLFAGGFAPRGWAQARGQLLPIAQHDPLFSVLGTTYGGDGVTTFGLPDLRGRTAIGKGRSYGPTDWLLGDQGGLEAVTLTEAHMPAHKHTLPAPGDLTGSTGGGEPHANMQPSLALNYTIALAGVYPSRDNGYGSDYGMEPLIGEVKLTASPAAAPGWAFCDGQSLPIAENTALFSILGTTYGGDGMTTFGLPDLRGRTVVGEGRGSGLTDRRLGMKAGSETARLTMAQMPAHNHTLPAPGDTTGFTGGGELHENMQPFLALNYIIAQYGVYPSQADMYDDTPMHDATAGLDPMIGQISLFAGAFAPRGWAFCDGQVLPIDENVALFSLLGTTYGGNGMTTFGLPDLRGRTAIGYGRGPGLTNWHLGARWGSEWASLNVSQLPAHLHTFTEPAGIPAPSAVMLCLLGLAGLRMRRRRTE